MKEIQVRDLEGVLCDYFKGDIKLEDVKSKMLTAPGEHYGSIMLAIDVIAKINGKKEKLNLVAKLIPASEMLREAFDIKVTFKKEVNFYLHALPALIQLQKEYKVPEERILDIFPICYGARVSLDKNKNEVDEDAVLIFENLKVQGYDTGDRFEGFDLQHAKLIVQDLAKFHALPIVLRKLKPNVFEQEVLPCLVQNYGLSRLPEDVKNAFRDSILKVGAEIPEIAHLVPRLKVIIQDAEEQLAKPRPPPKENYATIVHADYWVNNTMILKDENGNPIKNKIVDMQITQYESGIRDLVFFLFTSVTNTVLDEHYDEFLELYHKTFVNYLSDFKIDLEPYSWKKFLKEVDEIGPSEFHHIAFMLKPIFTEKGKVNSLDEFQPSDWSRRDLIGPAHARKLRDTVLAYLKRNWL